MTSRASKKSAGCLGNRAMSKTITVTCDTRDSLPFDALEVFQGGLKKRNDEDIRKIRESKELFERSGK